MEAYNLTDVNGSVVSATVATSIAANKPVLLKNAGDYVLTATNAAIAATADGTVANGLLVGGYATMTAAADNMNYVLQNSPTYGVGFYKVTGTAATVKPFRAYMHTAVAAPVLFLQFAGDEATGISATPNDNVKMTNDNVYDLQGRRVAHPAKGLYIINGKKVVIK